MGNGPLRAPQGTLSAPSFQRVPCPQVCKGQMQTFRGAGLLPTALHCPPPQGASSTRVGGFRAPCTLTRGTPPRVRIWAPTFVFLPQYPAGQISDPRRWVPGVLTGGLQNSTSSGPTNVIGTLSEFSAMVLAGGARLSETLHAPWALSCCPDVRGEFQCLAHTPCTVPPGPAQRSPPLPAPHFFPPFSFPALGAAVWAGPVISSCPLTLSCLLAPK